ncbi:Chaperone DnaJ-domain superfamily protein, putative isoform 1 [Hibiscus syriacus]|uniref:Chaperone DnaJ-domain superfamily protein, putative isoform 1 n=1 Tax=Hibiscus syriacus TaxID=106335 RepID=A0A6A2Z7P3_HIBSY|nr:Chaperone DnaJ-domain superfamily protein, putative isoform 1 [Hibiscus syriacus]
MDGNSAEAERWLSIAEKLLVARDLHGTRTFAIRARESAPILADQILAVTDTLLTAQSNPHDWYGILQLVPLTQSMEVVASQYRKLALLLNPGRNRLSFADQAFRFVSEAWNVLSNPSKKAIYDNELRFLQFGQPPPAPKETQSLFMQTPQKETTTQVTQQLFTRRSPRSTDRDGHGALEGEGQLGLNNKPPEPIWRRQMNQIGLAGTGQVNQSGSVGSSQISQVEPIQTSQFNRPEPFRMTQENQTGTDNSTQFNLAEPTLAGQINQTTTTPLRENSQTQPTSVTQPREATESDGLTFWTACPYCYVLYEYLKLYEDCTLKCQTKNCRRAFHAVVIPSPPVNGKDTFQLLGVFPIRILEGRVYYDDDDAYLDLSDSIGTSDDDDDDWQNEKRKKVKNAKGKGSVGRNAKKPQSERVKKATNEKADVDRSGNLSGVSAVPDGVPTAESSKRGVVNSGRKQMGRGQKNLGKLDLNVKFSNEVEEPVPRRNEGNHAGYGEEDNIEENGFFEGLDEFLSSLPILPAVGDDKVKAA